MFGLALPTSARAVDPVARMGQTISVDGPRVRPLAIVEDSRCAKEVQCIWAGQVKLRVRVITGKGSVTKIMSPGAAQPVADGALTLVRVAPEKSVKRGLRASDYRFAFRFEGGL
jgi:hypothetical protein